MSEAKEPAFRVGSDEILSGNEPEFEKCNLYKEKYLADISARPDVLVYARSQKWGFVLRMTYIDDAKSAAPPEGGTFICWRSELIDEVNVSIDVVGSADDLRTS